MGCQISCGRCRPICRGTHRAIGKTESALVRSLRHDLLLQARVERLMIVM